MDEVLSDGYLANVARSVGCPSMWLDDAVQEQRIGIWQAHADASLAPRIARRTAIDFMRHLLGRGTRHAPEGELPDTLAYDQHFGPVDGANRLSRVVAMLERMTPKQQATMLAGPGLVTRSRSRVRQRLRAA